MINLQALADAIGNASRRTRTDYHLTLGAAIKALEALPPEMPVSVNGGGATDPHSYRGYYNDLALEPSAVPTTAGALLAELHAALGETFEGYKGGDFVMGADTPLWLAEYGCCGEAIIALATAGDGAVLVTKVPSDD